MEPLLCQLRDVGTGGSLECLSNTSNSQNEQKGVHLEKLYEKSFTFLQMLTKYIF